MAIQYLCDRCSKVVDHFIENVNYIAFSNKDITMTVRTGECFELHWLLCAECASKVSSFLRRGDDPE